MRTALFFFIIFFSRLTSRRINWRTCEGGLQAVRTLAAENRWFMVSALSYTPPRECSPIHPLFGVHTA
jgi:hypothetical protein